jgi:nucleoside-diphosphate-sugar epimerase
MRVFLAGATGVIGTPLVPQLLRAGHEVTAMTRSVLRGIQLEAAGADPVVCDVFDADDVRAGIYNVVDDEPAPQPEWLPVLARALGADPPPAAETPPPPETPEMSLRGASNAKARRELGWRPRHASWRQGFHTSLA